MIDFTCPVHGVLSHTEELCPGCLWLEYQKIETTLTTFKRDAECTQRAYEYNHRQAAEHAAKAEEAVLLQRQSDAEQTLEAHERLRPLEPRAMGLFQTLFAPENEEHNYGIALQRWKITWRDLHNKASAARQAVAEHIAAWDERAVKNSAHESFKAAHPDIAQQLGILESVRHRQALRAENTLRQLNELANQCQPKDALKLEHRWPKPNWERYQGRLIGRVMFEGQAYARVAVTTEGTTQGVVLLPWCGEMIHRLEREITVHNSNRFEYWVGESGYNDQDPESILQLARRRILERTKVKEQVRVLELERPLQRPSEIAL